MTTITDYYIKIGFFARKRRPEELEPLHYRYPQAYILRPEASHRKRKPSDFNENLSNNKISRYDS